MSEIFKNKLESLIKDVFIKITDKVFLAEIQQKYDDLIETFYNLTVLSKDEFESIEKDITNYEENLRISKSKIIELNSVIENQKNYYEKNINILITQKDNYKSLEETNNVITKKYNEFENKYKACSKENIELNTKIKELENTINLLRDENAKNKKNIFEKFENINMLQKELKNKEINIDELNNKIQSLITKNTILEKNLAENENKLNIIKISYENNINILKKQIEQLTQSNNNFVKENDICQKKLNEFQKLTNMAKANVDKLEKKDFSILEIMSKKAETAENSYLLLKNDYDKLINENNILKKKIEPLENITLLSLEKEDSLFNSQNITREDIEQIEKIRNDPDELIRMIISLKNNNLILENQIKDITIEANKRLRDYENKNNNKNHN
jgi:hypothetical protein